MRATKEMFNSVVMDISNYMGENLYLVPVGYYMYLTPVNSRMECQRLNYLCLDNSYSNANYDKLRAFEKRCYGSLKAKISQGY